MEDRKQTDGDLYRIVGARGSIAYLPDHGPALGGFEGGDWTSGYDLARGADLLLHDAQYTDDEYAGRVGWGHSSIEHAVAIADLARAERLVMIHHEPEHSDTQIDDLLEAARSLRRQGDVVAAAEGLNLDL